MGDDDVSATGSASTCNVFVICPLGDILGYNYYLLFLNFILFIIIIMMRMRCVNILSFSTLLFYF